MRRTGMTVFLIMLLTALCAAAGAEESRFRPKDLPAVILTIDGGQAETDRKNQSNDHSYRCTGSPGYPGAGRVQRPV